MSGDDDSNGWQLTESDPGVFSELLKTLGVPLIVDDLYSLDSESLASLQPLHALIFLFKWVSTSSDSMSGNYDPEFPGFFAHQVVNNACATLAVLNALGNIPALKSGSQLTQLLEFTNGMDPQTRGLVITSSDWLREAHNSLSPPSAISLDGLGLPKQTEDAYHFVVYLPFMGSLYELDGLKPHAVRHGSYNETGEGWLSRAREVIENRIATYPPGALDFSLLALREDPLPLIQAELAELQAAGKQAEAAGLVVKLESETSKRNRWNFENSLRRHNHVGLVHSLLVSLAKAGKLESAKERAKGIMKERVSKAKSKGEVMDES
ncbi:MAG: ubiquitin carboxyl-terminal hydrolase [Lentinula lateritia]|uniref:Ubiquitin carboxyl-terminal hydrolase n=1 Tax=Lentinula lateritia TaxID=40482 RepID=A0ABQ8VV97_9AGAR|nr:MAG: ubiquitin carboxyl-terminal hydrolase [Lentinula lateritia]KAJ4500303.1 ubiquitin carboxyl-terminal hydrolase [Lentinula lateritia]